MKLCSGLSLMRCSLDDGTHSTTVLPPDTAFSSLADAATRSYHLGRAEKGRPATMPQQIRALRHVSKNTTWQRMKHLLSAQDPNPTEAVENHRNNRNEFKKITKP